MSHAVSLMWTKRILQGHARPLWTHMIQKFIFETVIFGDCGCLFKDSSVRVISDAAIIPSAVSGLRILFSKPETLAQFVTEVFGNIAYSSRAVMIFPYKLIADCRAGEHASHLVGVSRLTTFVCRSLLKFALMTVFNLIDCVYKLLSSWSTPMFARCRSFPCT